MGKLSINELTYQAFILAQAQVDSLLGEDDVDVEGLRSLSNQFKTYRHKRWPDRQIMADLLDEQELKQTPAHIIAGRPDSNQFLTGLLGDDDA